MSAVGITLCTNEYCFVAPQTSIVGEILTTVAVPCYSKGTGCVYNFDGSLSKSGVVGQATNTMTFTWDFGDGSAVQTGVGLMNPTHEYDTNGVYTVSLTVTDSNGLSNTQTAEITVAIENPIGVFSYFETNPCEFSFDGSDSVSRGCDSSLTYEWTFGDGGTSTDPSPTHTYAAQGTYSVSLTVTDSDGRLTTVSKNVTCTTDTIESDFTYSSLNGIAFTFDGSSATPKEGVITTYAWAFGDGAIASTVNPSHSYTENGTYDVSLTVTDTGGNTDTKTCRIVVSQGPFAVQEQIDVPTLNTVQTGGQNSYTFDGEVDPTELSWNFRNHDNTLYASATGAPADAPASALLSNTHLNPQMELDTWYEANATAEVATPSFTATPAGLTINLDGSASAVGASCAGSISSYEWYVYDVDGVTVLGVLSGATPSIVVAATGDYVVVLRIKTTTCGEAITGQIVTV